MLEYLSWFLIGVVYYFANIYIVTNLLNRKINRKKDKCIFIRSTCFRHKYIFYCKFE